MSFTLNRLKARSGQNRITPVGDDGSAAAAAPSVSIGSLVSSPGVKTVSGAVLLWHGYRRTGSILMALLYGLAGRTVPIVAVPIALAQGMGAKKACP